MDKPTININGKNIEMPKPTAGVWRKIMEFDSTKYDVKWINFVDDYVSIIALAFGITVEELIDKDENLIIEYEDIIPIYNDVVIYLTNLVVSKIGDKKNENAEVKAQV